MGHQEMSSDLTCPRCSRSDKPDDFLECHYCHEYICESCSVEEAGGLFRCTSCDSWIDQSEEISAQISAGVLDIGF